MSFEELLTLIETTQCSPERFREIAINVCRQMAFQSPDDEIHDRWRKLQSLLT